MGRHALGALHELQVGVPKILRYPGRPPKLSMIVLRLDARARAESVRVYWNVCKHLPVPLDGGAFELPEAKELICITHGAAYRGEDGLCIRGPCEGAHLESIPVELEGGELYVLL